jgi:hypothetical protein
MVHSTNSSIDEDYWYANEACRFESGETSLCQKTYLKKNTQVPLRSTEVVRHKRQVIQAVTNYQIISMGKPDEKYFGSIPKNWSVTCLDVNLDLLYYREITTIGLNQSTNIHISLSVLPHRINGRQRDAKIV